MKVLAIAANELRRLFRWRANVFFLFVLPMLIILLLGAAFGGSQKARLGVLGGTRGALGGQLVAALREQPSTQVVRYRRIGALQQAVARGDADAGLIIPADYDARLSRGAGVRLSYLGRPDSLAQQVRLTVRAVASHASRAIAAAALVATVRREPFPVALRRAQAAARATPPSVVAVTAPDGTRYRSAAGRFESGASTQLLLFIFLNSLNGAAWLIETRRRGIGRRILSTPTSSGTLLTGQLLGRFAVALVQALVIVLGSLIFFGVDWGDPLGTSAVIVSFCLVSTGIAVLLGSLFSSEQQAGPVALLLGLGLAALGGSMAPLEVFPSAARTIAHVTPHAWANDAFSKLLAHGGDIVTVLPQVGVLLAFAAGAISLAVYVLRRSLTT
ncbi:MAG: ABC transporter permease [Solirubrobacteraceae bacterium]